MKRRSATRWATLQNTELTRLTVESAVATKLGAMISSDVPSPPSQPGHPVFRSAARPPPSIYLGLWNRGEQLTLNSDTTLMERWRTNQKVRGRSPDPPNQPAPAIHPGDPPHSAVRETE